MKIDHIALFVSNLEVMRVFYEKYFSAKSNQRYHNPVTGLETYFLTFPGGETLIEIMSRPDIVPRIVHETDSGYVHFAISCGSRADVDRMTAELSADGHTICRLPRVTGDGYYESVVMDPEGNRIEIVG